MKRMEQKKSIAPQTRRHLSDEFKAEAVRMMQERRAGVSLAHIAARARGDRGAVACVGPRLARRARRWRTSAWGDAGARESALATRE